MPRPLSIVTKDAHDSVGDILAFAKKNPPRHGRTCYVCGLPNVVDLNAAFASGVMVATLHRYLTEKMAMDPEALTKHRLHYHFGQKHHLRT